MLDTLQDRGYTPVCQSLQLSQEELSQHLPRPQHQLQTLVSDASPRDVKGQQVPEGLMYDVRRLQRSVGTLAMKSCI